LPSPTPETPEGEIRSLIAKLPEKQIKALLSDVPARKKGEPMFLFLERAVPAYFELRTQILKQYNLKDLDPLTQKRFNHFSTKTDILRGILNQTLETLIK
jgi:hypothetical protein